MISIRRSLYAILAAALLVPAMAAADYPDKPIRLIVAFPAGGSSDIVARMVSEQVSKQSDYNFVVENRTGAGGNIAFAEAAHAKPDGYTLLFSTPGIAINPSLYRKVDFKTTDFAPVALVGQAPLVLMVNPKLPIHSIQDLIKASQAKPDAIRFASSGNGSSSHLATEVLRSMTELQYLHVPYKGGSAAITDLIGGRVDITMLPISESLPYIRDERLRALGQTGATRSPIAPDIPTIAEGGIEGYSVATWYMVLGPAGLPDEVTAKLAREFDRALKTPDLQERLQKAGVSVINDGPKQASAFLQDESRKWARAIEASGTKIE